MESTFQGKACRHGHGGLRYKANRACVDCTKAHSKSSYDKESARLAKAKQRAARKAPAAIGESILASL